MNCPRCSSLVFRDMAGGTGCPVCGWEYVPPLEMEKTRRVVESDRLRRTTHQRLKHTPDCPWVEGMNAVALANEVSQGPKGAERRGNG